jgi:hypothetical protein
MSFLQRPTNLKTNHTQNLQLHKIGLFQTACATGDMSQFDQKSHELPPSSNLNIMTGEEYTDFVDYLSAAESFSESEDAPDEDEKQEPHKNQTFLDSLKKFYFF